jgi:hypothetical protein
VDVPEQMDPAPLLQTRIMVVGSMEITDQHPLEQLAQYLIHHLLVPACSGLFRPRRMKYPSLGVLKSQT